MEKNTLPKRIHPLVAGAAISVMLVSLTGVAAITGLIPSSHSTAASASPVAASVGAAAAASSPAALVEPRADTSLSADVTKPESSPTAVEAKKYAPRTAQAKESHPRRTYAPSSSAKVASASPVCHSCGRVESVRAIQHAAQPSGIGMVAGAVLGGVLGNQVGGGNGRKLATVAGAVGGGYAGNAIEKQSRTSVSYQVAVRMEDGKLRSFPYQQQPGWNVGDRVRVVNGELASRG